MTRVAYGAIEEIYETKDDYFDMLEDFSAKHPEIDLSECTVTEVGSFYDRNR